MSREPVDWQEGHSSTTVALCVVPVFSLVTLTVFPQLEPLSYMEGVRATIQSEPDDSQPQAPRPAAKKVAVPELRFSAAGAGAAAAMALKRAAKEAILKAYIVRQREMGCWVQVKILVVRKV